MQASSARVARLVTRLTAVIALLLAVAPTGVFVTVIYFGVAHQLDANARVQAAAIADAISAQPDFWNMNANGIQAAYSRHLVPDEHFHVLNERGDTVVERGPAETWHMLVRSYPLLDFGREVGRVEAGRSILDAIVFGLIIFLLSITAAYAVWGPLRRVPLDALARFENKLLRKEQYQQALLDNFPFMVWLTDTDNRFLATNAKLAKRLGAPSGESLIGKTATGLVPGQLDAVYRKPSTRKQRKRGSAHIERRLESNFGERWYEIYQKPVFLPSGEPIGAVGYSRDITEKKRAEEKLQLAASVFTHAHEGIVITSADGTIIDVNEAFTKLTGYSREEILGRNPQILYSGRQTKAFFSAMWRDLTLNGHWYGEVWNQHKNGNVYATMQTISAVRDAEGNTSEYVALLSDITPLKEYEKQLEHIAHYDALTGLPNRVLLADRLQQARTQSQRHGKQLAVVFLDLDGFKATNDTHGHEVGDRLLTTIASRVKQSMREGDTFARLGGDEFVAVLQDLSDTDMANALFGRLLSCAAQPALIDDIKIQVSASVGVTFYPQATDVTAEQLLRQADQAMYRAKQAGKNRFHIFNAELDGCVRSHHETLERIRLALNKEEFLLHFQPKVNMRTGEVIGVEALIRWQHPESGLLPPATFLPTFEDNALAVEVGEWVINAALLQIERWNTEGLHLQISVNVGARQIQQANFCDRLRAILADHPNVSPNELQIEILETSALQDLSHVSDLIKNCQKYGVSFALDDFGSGYSSLTYLKRLAVSQIKIDQGFIRGVLDNPDDLITLEGVLGITTAFHRQVIAEGVETTAHGEMLLQLGCELAQGYGIAHPMPAADIPLWIATWRPVPTWLNRQALGRDDLPLLFASTEYPAWVDAVEAYLKQEDDSNQAPQISRCDLSTWLTGAGYLRHGKLNAFSMVALDHQQIHALVTELYALRNAGQATNALTRLDDLHRLRDTLTKHIHALLQEVQPPDEPTSASVPTSGPQQSEQNRVECLAAARSRRELAATATRDIGPAKRTTPGTNDIGKIQTI